MIGRCLTNNSVGKQGNELVKELRVKPGMAIRQLLEKVIVWQVESLQMTKSECLARIQAAL